MPRDLATALDALYVPHELLEEIAAATGVAPGVLAQRLTRWPELAARTQETLDAVRAARG